jgi:hypothetical protein
VSEGSEGVAGSLLREDVVLLVPLVGAAGRYRVGSTARPSGGGAQAHRCCGRRCLDAGKGNWVGR